MKKLLIIFLIFWVLTANAAEIKRIEIKPTFFEKVFSTLSSVWECKWHLSCYRKLGVTITTIAGSDTVKDALKTTVNNNFTALNSGKIENSTSSVASITTLSNLSSIGTITTGTWTGTAIGVAKGGSGTTTWSTGQIILGNGSNGATTTNGWGTSGQFLTSDGSGVAPSWTTSAVDLGIAYAWTGLHSFSATTTMATTTATNLGIATTTPALNNGLSVAGDAYISSGLGVGQATTSDGNLRVSNYLQVDGTASTTDLIVSGNSNLSFSDRYMGTTTAISVSATNKDYVQLLSNAKDVIIGWVISSTGDNTMAGSTVLSKAGANTISVGGVTSTGSGTSYATYAFTWSGTNINVAESADTDGDSTITGTIYWYK